MPKIRQTKEHNLEVTLNEADCRGLHKGRSTGVRYGDKQYHVLVNMINPLGVETDKKQPAEIDKDTMETNIYILHETLKNPEILESNFSKELGNLIINSESNELNNMCIKVIYPSEFDYSKWEAGAD